eukprot:CAMPEP_0182852652 /NCGR_PEP_ID=MMETSP0034_2-20130328/273_1 /TAXON_ID=156128 /ORGANISM="Nephroselmis pyriformis, Strain CCMP717" /LENGTH=141 /DNA_ID=CAMNT_0024983377 /DNA_START=322 /DNA_END=747 /DNA_ORIENTATION=-
MTPVDTSGVVNKPCPLQIFQADFSELQSQPSTYGAVYSRFSLHSVTEEKSSKTLRWAFDALIPGGLLAIEVRSTEDELYGVGQEVGRNAFFSDHYRRFINMTELVGELQDIGFSVLFEIKSRGLAPYKEEDPIAIRVIAQK